MRTNSHVEPVGIVRGQLFVGGGLDQVDPLGELDLAGALKVCGVRLDECVGLDVLDGDSSRRHADGECVSRCVWK